MAKLIVVLFAFVAMASLAHGELVCSGEHEALSQSTPVCPATCANHGKPECIGRFQKHSCQCEHGFVRDTKVSQKCVKLEECPKTLSPVKELLCSGENEELSGVTRACPPTCANHGKPTCFGLSLKPSCQCMAGFVRDTKLTGKCMTLEQCPEILPKAKQVKELLCSGENEEWSGVTRACPPTCANHGKPTCFGLSLKPSCQCMVGFVRDTKLTGKCMTLEQCPEILPKAEQVKELLCSGKNEEWSGVTHVCPPTCANHGKPKCLGLYRKPSCQCMAGFVRDTKLTGECMTLEQCPDFRAKRSVPQGKSLEELELEQYTDAEKQAIRKSCDPATEVYTESVSACPASCMHGFKSGILCHTMVAKPACVCRAGYLRDAESGKCILESKCRLSI